MKKAITLCMLGLSLGIVACSFENVSTVNKQPTTDIIAINNITKEERIKLDEIEATLIKNHLQEVYVMGREKHKNSNNILPFNEYYASRLEGTNIKCSITSFKRYGTYYTGNVVFSFNHYDDPLSITIYDGTFRYEDKNKLSTFEINPASM